MKTCSVLPICNYSYIYIALTLIETSRMTVNNKLVLEHDRGENPLIRLIMIAMNFNPKIFIRLHHCTAFRHTIFWTHSITWVLTSAVAAAAVMLLRFSPFILQRMLKCNVTFFYIQTFNAVIWVAYGFMITLLTQSPAFTVYKIGHT